MLMEKVQNCLWTLPLQVLAANLQERYWALPMNGFAGATTSCFVLAVGNGDGHADALLKMCFCHFYPFQLFFITSLESN